MNQRLWYALYTYPNKEKKALSMLVGYKIEAFLPLQKEIRQWHDRRKKIEVPLFPNYIFVRICANERELVYSVPQIRYFISIEGKASVVPEEEIDTIKKAINGGVKVSNQVFSRKGEMVLISEGPFAGRKGVIVRLNGKTKIGLQLESLNKSILLDIEASMVKKFQPLQYA